MNKEPVQYPKWSPTRNDPRARNDPQIVPEMIPDPKWSPSCARNDPQVI